MKMGRNEPCHCGSGKKYKKCCLRKDEELQRRELKEQKYERDVQRGRIDPFAGDEDWEEELVEESVEKEEEYSDIIGSPDVMDDDFPALTAEIHDVSESAVPKLSAEQDAIIDEWGSAYVKISDPDELRDHIENFMDSHPELVVDLDLNSEPLLELGGMYVRQGRHLDHIEVLTRLRSEFPDAYSKGFVNFDSIMISWLVMNDQKGTVMEYLDNFRADPCRDPDHLFELIYFLMSWNCQKILADFLPEICNEVCTSPKVIGGGEILSPMIAIIMAPCLDQGLDACDPEKLAEEIKTLGGIVNPVWTDPDFLRSRVKFILGKHEGWNLDDCRTRRQAVDRYAEMTYNFMGWLVENTGLDWCAAEYYRQRVFEYLVEALPEKKKHRKAFPFEEKNMEHLVVRLSKNMMWLDSTRLFGMLNGLYWFQGFLEDTRSLSPEQAELNREACVRLFEMAYPAQRVQDFQALAWERFPCTEFRGHLT